MIGSMVLTKKAQNPRVSSPLNFAFFNVTDITFRALISFLSFLIISDTLHVAAGPLKLKKLSQQ